MSEFDYLAVFVAIIFGISLTRILEGAIRSIYCKTADENQLVWTLFIFLVMILNWWTGYSWHNQQIWNFDLFLIIIIWAMAHFLTAVMLYPPDEASGEKPFEHRRKWFLWSFIAVAMTDILQTAARGDVFNPWFYLPFVLHYAVLSLIGTFIQKPRLHRWLAWYFLITLSIWALVVRRLVV